MIRVKTVWRLGGGRLGRMSTLYDKRYTESILIRREIEKQNRYTIPPINSLKVTDSLIAIILCA